MILGEAPKVTEALIASKIIDVAFTNLENTLITVCVITLENGFTVTGESACVSEENFDKDIGENIAYNNAKEKVWVLEGYLLKEQVFIETECKPDLIYQYQELDELGAKLWEEIHELKQIAGTENIRRHLKNQRKCIKQYLKILHERMIEEGIIVMATTN